MSFTYFIRFFDADRGMLRMQMIPCADDAEAIAIAGGEVPPRGWATVEVERESELIWRRDADSADIKSGVAMNRGHKSAA